MPPVGGMENTIKFLQYFFDTWGHMYQLRKYRTKTCTNQRDTLIYANDRSSSLAADLKRHHASDDSTIQD